MSIATEIQRLAQAKADIKSAIEEKGVTVGDGTIDTFATKINEISTGGGDYQKIIDRTITELNDDTISIIGTSAFAYCNKLQTVICPSATTIQTSAFDGCTALKRIEFDNATYCSALFRNCSNLEYISFEKLTAVGTSSSSQTFSNCKALTTVNFPLAERIYNFSFTGCSALITVCFPKCTTVEMRAFDNCTSLSKVDFPVMSSLGYNVFDGCQNLTKVIIRTGTVATLKDIAAFNSTPIASGTGYIYVPRALLSDDDATKDYRRATNWSNFASRFRALEDYTVDGTVNGELDESKI